MCHRKELPLQATIGTIAFASALLNKHGIVKLPWGALTRSLSITSWPLVSKTNRSKRHDSSAAQPAWTTGKPAVNTKNQPSQLVRLMAVPPSPKLILFLFCFFLCRKGSFRTVFDCIELAYALFVAHGFCFRLFFLQLLASFFFFGLLLGALYSKHFCHLTSHSRESPLPPSIRRCRRRKCGSPELYSDKSRSIFSNQLCTLLP